MKKLIILLFIALCTVQGVYAGIDHLLPQPQKIVKRKGVFNLNRTIQLILPPTHLVIRQLNQSLEGSLA
jgi:hypothetical protein